MEFKSNIKTIQEILSNANMGMWAMELEDNTEPRLYGDETMRRLLGVTASITPEQLYRVWYDNIHPEDFDKVKNYLERMKNGEKVEFIFSWFLNGDETYIRCEGHRNDGEHPYMRLEGCYHSIKEYIEAQKRADAIKEENDLLDMKNRRNDAIIGIMANEYRAVYHVDIATGVMTAHAMNGEFKDIYNEIFYPGILFEDGMNMYIDMLVIEEDRPYVREMIKMSKILDEFKKHSLFRFNFRVNKEGKELYFQIKCVKIDRDEGATAFVITFALIDDAMRMELQNKKSREMISGLSADYAAVFLANYDSEDVEIVRMSDKLQISKITTEKKYKYYDYMKKVAKMIYTEDREEFFNKLQLENVKKTFEEDDHFYHMFRITNTDGVFYFQIKVTRTGDWDKSREFIIGLHNVDKATRAEFAKNAELNKALKAADAANKAKTTFLFNMSHDIRTPMNAIIGFTEMATKYIDDKERTAECLSKVKNASEHLLSLINDVLDMSRIESGTVVIEPKAVYMRECRQDIINLLGNSAAEKGLEFTATEEETLEHPYVYLDELRLNRVLINIINNAIKYTPTGGKVEYSVRELPCEKKGYAQFRFRIKDNGIGMSEEFCKHMFEPFSREKSSTVSGITGTGLGLSITKELVELMGGHIEVNSKLGEGTEVDAYICFKIAEELQKAAEAATTEKVEATEESAQVTESLSPEEVLADKYVLLVEDNMLNREIAVDILEDMNMEVDTAEDGTVAVDKYEASIDSKHYDFILMDVQMPIMNGYVATENIRRIEEEKGYKVPIIAMTANAFAEDREKALAAGMNEHLPKPIDINALTQTLIRFRG